MKSARWGRGLHRQGVVIIPRTSDDDEVVIAIWSMPPNCPLARHVFLKEFAHIAPELAPFSRNTHFFTKNPLLSREIREFSSRTRVFLERTRRTRSKAPPATSRPRSPQVSMGLPAPRPWPSRARWTGVLKMCSKCAQFGVDRGGELISADFT